MPAGPFWRCTEAKVVRDNLHLSDPELARMLGRTADGVAAFRLAHGMRKRKRLCPHEVAQRRVKIIEMARAGIAKGVIAYRLNCDRKVVYNALRGGV